MFLIITKPFYSGCWLYWRSRWQTSGVDKFNPGCT